jgi:hypothetical protein
MRFQVPQFIDIEDKVIGPFTIKQFVYLAGGAGMSFIIYTYIPVYIALLLIAGVIGLSLALAFYRINNKPFIYMLEAAFLYYTKQNLYIWKKQEKKPEKQEQKSIESPQVYVPRLSDSKLKDLSWSLDINENLNPLTGQDGRNTK